MQTESPAKHLTALRDRVLELIHLLGSGSTALTFIMTSEAATKLDIHAELAKLEHAYFVQAPEILRKLEAVLPQLPLEHLPKTPEERAKEISAWQQAVKFAQDAVAKLRYLFETGLPVGTDWHVIDRELQAAPSSPRTFVRLLDKWINNIHLGRKPAGTPANVPGGVVTPPASDPTQLTSDEKKRLREEMERRRHLSLQEQLQLAARDLDTMKKSTPPAEKKTTPVTPKTKEQEAVLYELDDDGNPKLDRFGRPIQKVLPPKSPEEFALREKEEHERFHNKQKKWGDRMVRRLEAMGHSTRLNRLLPSDQPFGIMMGSIVSTHNRVGRMALDAARSAKSIIGAKKDGYLLLRNVPVLGVDDDTDPREALQWLKESTSPVLEKQRRWARFWNISSTPVYKGGHRYFILWPNSLSDDTHRVWVERWDFNMQDAEKPTPGNSAQV